MKEWGLRNKIKGVVARWRGKTGEWRDGRFERVA